MFFKKSPKSPKSPKSLRTPKPLISPKSSDSSTRVARDETSGGSSPVGDDLQDSPVRKKDDSTAQCDKSPTQLNFAGSKEELGDSNVQSKKAREIASLKPQSTQDKIHAIDDHYKSPNNSATAPKFNNLFTYHRYAHELANFFDKECYDGYNILWRFSNRPRNLHGEWEDYFTCHNNQEHQLRLLRVQAYVKALESFCFLATAFLNDERRREKIQSKIPSVERSKLKKFATWVEAMLADAFFARRTLQALEHLYQDYDESKLGLPKIEQEDLIKKLETFREHHDEIRKLSTAETSEKTMSILQKVAYKILSKTIHTIQYIEGISEYTFYESCQHAIATIHTTNDLISRKRALGTIIRNQHKIPSKEQNSKWAKAFKDMKVEDVIKRISFEKAQYSVLKTKSPGPPPNYPPPPAPSSPG